MPRIITEILGAAFQLFRLSSAEENHEQTHREESLLTQRLAEIRAEYMKDMLNIWMHVCGMNSIQYFFRLLIGQPNIRDGFWGTWQATIYLPALAVQVYPGLVNRHTLWMLHSWYMGMLMCYGVYVAFTDGSLFAFTNIQVHLARVVLALSYPEALPNFLWNAAWAIMASVTFLRDESACLEIPASNMIVIEIVIVAVSTYVIRRFQKLQSLLVRSELDAKGHLRAKETVEMVLTNMCDAVVELDRMLDVRRPCQKLAGLLIRPLSNTALQGEAFPDLLMTDEDRERFENFVSPRAVPIEQEEQNVGADVRAECAYVSLRDSSGTAVSVQLFHSCHYEPPDNICHIVGVREVQEVVGFQNFCQQGAMVAHAAAPAGQNDHDETESVNSVGSSGTESLANLTLAPLIPEGAMLDPVSAVLNPVHMHTIACTTDFRAFTGPIFFRSSFMDLVVNKTEFRQWVQKEFTARLCNLETSKFELKFTPAIARKRPRFEFQADCYLIWARVETGTHELGLEEEYDEEQEHEALCVIAFRDVQPRWRNVERHRRNRAVPQSLAPRQYGKTL